MKNFYALFAILLALTCIPYITSAQEDDGGQVEVAEILEAEKSDAVEIRDSNLASAIRSMLGLDTDAEITSSDMLNLSSLRAKDAGIMDLSGLEHATHLTTLNLSTNSISNLSSLKDLPVLVHLNLYSNQLTDLGPLSGLESLTFLDVGKNEITDIEALADLTDLRDLYLDENKLTDFSDLSSLTGLSVLTLSRTGISDLSVLGDLTSLTQLYLMGNAISDISALSGLTKLGWLFLAENQISDVSPLQGMEALISLRLLGNPVSDASVLYALTQVSLIDVDIEILPPVDTDPPSVSIAVPSDTQTGAFDVVITFSEAVSDFSQADLTVSGTATATVTAWRANAENTVYTATLTPTTGGEVVLSVAADVATDAANNNNTASETQTVTVDMTPPEVSISVPVGVQNSAFDIVITFTEVVSDFEQSDLSVSGTAAATVTAWSMTDETTYTATITPTTSGTLTLSIAEGAVTDTAGNTNVLSTAEVSITLNVPEDTEVSLTVFVSVCDRTPQVRDAIVAAVPNVSDCANVTAVDLATIMRLDIRSQNITALKEGDFNGLTVLEYLYLDDNELSSLLSGIFDDLTVLKYLSLGNNALSSLPEGIFDELIKLETLYLYDNELSSLPSGIFDDLTALEYLSLRNNELGSLLSGIFDDLTALEYLILYDNALSSLPSGIFDDLTVLKYLSLRNNKLGSLPADIFDDLTGLMWLSLGNNRLGRLPDGIFDGLTALEKLDLSGNTVDPIPLTVSLEQVEAGQFKATAPTGAPFDIVVPLSVTHGSIDDEGTPSITISTGRVESESLTVTRTPGTTDAVLVDIGTLPGLPNNALHLGYQLVKSADLPLTVIDALGNAAPRIAAVDALPSETMLSANYPNPFNPETWIPYELSNTSDVKITIYDGRGRVVRELDLGHQSAGYYTSRVRAAYWDGRNNMGERVASGIYFYQFEADNISFLRKMVILK